MPACSMSPELKDEIQRSKHADFRDGIRQEGNELQKNQSLHWTDKSTRRAPCSSLDKGE